MVAAFVLLLLVTFIATWWARQLAIKRGRNAGAWALATALLPPIVLLLWGLPARSP